MSSSSDHIDRYRFSVKRGSENECLSGPPVQALHWDRVDGMSLIMAPKEERRDSKAENASRT